MNDAWWIGWQHRAKCRGEDSSLFFPEQAIEDRVARRARESGAKALCAVCPVRTECLEYALKTREPYGIWGGLNEYERRSVLRDRSREARSA